MLINLMPMPKKISLKKSNVDSKMVGKKILYKYEYDPKFGCPRRVPSGVMDMQDYIQQSADDVDFKQIGKMLVDTKANAIDHFTYDGEVFDVTKLPRNIHEYEAQHNKMLQEFDNIDPGVKALFGNDFDQFANAWRSGSLGQILDNYSAAQEAAAKAQEVENNDK